MNKEVPYSSLDNFNLPKWPQMMVKGATTTEEQALDILRRTDKFFVGFGGNDIEYNHDVSSMCLQPVLATSGFSKSRHDHQIYQKLFDEWKAVWQPLENLSYISNARIATAFAYGPNGWIDPHGNIEYEFNIGKWPDASDVFDDWAIVAKIWPFLDLDVVLMDGESAEDDLKPVIGFRVQKGQVVAIDVESNNDLISRFGEITPLDRDMLFSHVIGKEISQDVIDKTLSLIDIAKMASGVEFPQDYIDAYDIFMKTQEAARY